MKRLMFSAVALLLLSSVAAQPEYGAVYAPSTLNAMTAVSYDPYALLSGVEVVDNIHTLTDEELQSDAVASIRYAVASVSFQFGDGYCRVIVPDGTDASGNDLYRTYTFASTLSADTMMVDCGDERMRFLFDEDSAQWTFEADLLDALELIDLLDVSLALGCSNLMLDCTLLSDHGWTLDCYIAPSPFTMRYMAPNGIFNFVDFELSSNITALYPSTELLEAIIDQDYGMAVVCVGSADGCPPCAKFNADAFRPAVRQWLKRDDVGGRVVIVYIDVNTDKDNIELLRSRLSIEQLSWPAVYFVSGGKSIVEPIEGVTDDAYQKLVDAVK